MKPIPAIVEPAQVDVDLLEQQVKVALAEERQTETSAERHEQQAAAARETVKMRRVEIGKMLRKARGAWPERGPNAKGWGEFLKRIGLDQSTAWRYMNPEQAKPDDSGFMQPHENSGRGDRDAKPANVPPLSLVPDPAPEVEIDRDTWCTPRWLTEVIGHFDLDPCSNERSTVRAEHTCQPDRPDCFGPDGLSSALAVAPSWRVFVNPPYSDVPPWIAAYKHTRFCFLLKLDTSTRWFAELFAATQLILIPRKRVSFEPPPGVPPEHAKAQQFPHALFYAHAEDATDAIRALCWSWRVEH